MGSRLPAAKARAALPAIGSPVEMIASPLVICSKAEHLAKLNTLRYQATGLAPPDEKLRQTLRSGVEVGRDVQLSRRPALPVEMALKIWKSRPFSTFCISSRLVGNDFQRRRRNQGFRHFHMSTISTPYGGWPPLNIGGRPGRRG
jgi:hypothetical protein